MGFGRGSGGDLPCPSRHEVMAHSDPTDLRKKGDKKKNSTTFISPIPSRPSGLKVITLRTARSMLPPRLWGCMISSSTTLQVCPSTVPSQPPSPALPGVLVLRSVRPPPSAAVTLVSEMARHASIPQAGRAVTGSVNGPGHETRRWLSCSEERERGRDQVKKKKKGSL